MPSLLKQLGSSGIEELLKSIDRTSLNRNAPTVPLTINVSAANHSFEVSVPEGASLQGIVEGGDTELSDYLECACGGIMACSTCHVILEESLYRKLDPPCEAEQDMLDLAWGLSETSRLGCQLSVQKNYEGTSITIPEGVNNMF